MTKVRGHCGICGELAFTGTVREYEYPRGTGETKQDVDGRLEPGAGQCEECGEYYCADHNDLKNGVCHDCLLDLQRMDEHYDDDPVYDDDDEDYCPF